MAFIYFYLDATAENTANIELRRGSELHSIFFLSLTRCPLMGEYTHLASRADFSSFTK